MREGGGVEEDKKNKKINRKAVDAVIKNLVRA